MDPYFVNKFSYLKYKLQNYSTYYEHEKRTLYRGSRVLRKQNSFIAGCLKLLECGFRLKH